MFRQAPDCGEGAARMRALPQARAAGAAHGLDVATHTRGSGLRRSVLSLCTPQQCEYFWLYTILWMPTNIYRTCILNILL